MELVLGRTLADLLAAGGPLEIPEAVRLTRHLLEALQASGGGVNALARHGTAALLNASSSGVEYQFSVATVIQMVQDAIDGSEEDMEEIKNILAEANEAGCPLN